MFALALLFGFAITEFAWPVTGRLASSLRGKELLQDKWFQDIYQ